MSVAVFVVAEPSAPSGGHAYNAAVVEHWPGPPPTVVPLAGPWPRGDAGSLRRLEDALDGRRLALVDGLVGAAQPDLIARAAERGCRVVLLIHLPLADEGGLAADDRAALGRCEAQSVQVAWRVIATSRTAAAQVAGASGRSDVIAVPPGVRPAPLAASHRPPGVVQVGAIGPRKNQLATLAALARCRDLDFTATFAGPVADPAYAEVFQHGLAGANARWVGPLDEEALDRLYAGADLLLHPALAETWGMVITEALARGVPAIVGAGTGAVEALRSGPSSGLPGAVVDLRDPDALTHALRGWLSDPHRRAQWRTQAELARAGLRGWSDTAAELARVLAA